MPDRHKHKPLRFRPPESDLLWLLEHSAQTGRPVNAVLSDALAAYRASLSGPTTLEASGPTTQAVQAPSGPTTRKQPRPKTAPKPGPPAPPPPEVIHEAIVPLEGGKPRKTPESATDIAAFFRSKR